MNNKNRGPDGGRIRRAVLFLLALCALAGSVIALFPSPFLTPIGEFLIVRDDPARSDAIVVLLGQEETERTDRAVTLYRDGWAPLLVFLQGFRDRPWFGIEDPDTYRWVAGGKRYRDLFRSAGVPEEAIVLLGDPNAHDTSTELQGVAEDLRQRDARRVTLVTSASHSRRVALVWHRIAPDIKAVVVPALDQNLSTWWSNRRGRRTILYEYGALAKEMVRRILSLAMGTI